MEIFVKNRKKCCFVLFYHRLRKRLRTNFNFSLDDHNSHGWGVRKSGETRRVLEDSLPIARRLTLATMEGILPPAREQEEGMVNSSGWELGKDTRDMEWPELKGGVPE